MAEGMEGFNMGEGEASKPPFSGAVCLCARIKDNSGENKIHWYMIDVSDDSEVTSFIRPCHKDNFKRMEKEAKRRAILAEKLNDIKLSGGETEKLEEFSYTSMPSLVRETTYIPSKWFWTALGSTVYCFGAIQHGVSRRFTHKVRCWDLSDPQKSMDQVAPMLSSRMGGKAVTLEGNIFVFGGTKLDSSSKPWAEVFCKNDDNNQGYWKPLKQPSFRLPSTNLFVLPMQNTILVGSLIKRGLYTYNIYQDSWDVMDPQFRLTAPFYSEPVVVENTLYWVGDELIHAYELNEKKYCSGNIHFWAIKELMFIGRCAIYFDLPLFHLHDDIFCMIWKDVEYYAGCAHDVLVVHKFSVTKRMKEGEQSLRVKALSTDYLLPRERSLISFDGIVLNTGDGGVASGSG